MSANFPHSSTSALGTSFSSSYATQSNLETLIERHLSHGPHHGADRRRSSAASGLNAHERQALLRGEHPSTVDEDAIGEEDIDTTGDEAKRAKLLSIVGGGHQPLSPSASPTLLPTGRNASLTRSTGAVSQRSLSAHSNGRSPSRVRSLASGHVSGFTSADVTAAATVHGGARLPKPEEDAVGWGGNGEGQMLLDPMDELDAVVDLGLPADEDGEALEHDWKASVRKELPILLWSTAPVYVTQVAEYSLVLVSVISIGHLGTTELAASSLASMTAAVTSFSILQGMASALDTLLPAAWTSDDPTRVGLWTQRMVIVMSVFLIPMYFVWWNASAILLLLKQEPEVAEMAEQYLKVLSIGIPGYALNQVMRKYFQSQNLMTAPTVVIAAVAPLNALLQWLLVWGPEPVRLGFVGAPLATAISFNFAAIVGLLYAAFIAPKTAWGGFSKEAFTKLGTVTSLGLAGTIMISSEWWAWEFVSIAASQLGPVVLAVNSILLSFSSTMYQVPQSLGIATAVRVGNLLGAGRPYEAMVASRLALCITTFTALVTSLILIVFRGQLVYLFNSDPPVVEMVPKVAIYVAAFQLADGLVGTMSGVLRAVGKQSAGALFNLTAYYVFGLPIGVWFCFSLHWDLAGLWIGLTVALFYCAFATVWIVLRLDWDHAVEKTRARLGLAPGQKGGESGVVGYGTMGH